MAPLRGPLIRSQLPPALQKELKIRRDCWQRRLVSAVLHSIGTCVLVVLFGIPFLWKLLR